jgi:hypothetical protein
MTTTNGAPQLRGPPGGRPPARRRKAGGTTFVTLAALSVVAAVGLLLVVLQLAKNPSVKNQLGVAVFEAGRAKDLLGEIQPRGGGRAGPILLQDPLGHGRDIYIQHEGGDPLAGWLAFEAHAPGAARRCVLQWVQAQNLFRDACDGTTFPADGTGLTHYPATVSKSTTRVSIDLRHPLP